MFAWILFLTLCTEDGKCATEPVARANSEQQCVWLAKLYAEGSGLPEGVTGNLACNAPTQEKGI